MIFKKLKLKKKAIAAIALVLFNLICILALPFSYNAVAGLVLINLICILSGWLALSINNKIISHYRKVLSVYPTKKNYRICDTRNYDVANLGSSDAKRLFNYELAGIKGLNWAQTSQTLKYDLLILKNFHSALKKNGVVILPIGIGAFYPAKTDDSLYPFYARFIDPLLLSNDTQFSKANVQVRREKYPLLFDFSNSVKLLLNGLKAGKQKMSEDPRSAAEKSRPGTFNLEYEVREKVAIIREIADFCEERELRLVVLIPRDNQGDSKTEEDEAFHQLLKIIRNEEKSRNIQIVNYPPAEPTDSREATNAPRPAEMDPATFTRNIFHAITKVSHA